jgi:hypothetical protein
MIAATPFRHLADIASHYFITPGFRHFRFDCWPLSLSPALMPPRRRQFSPIPLRRFARLIIRRFRRYFRRFRRCFSLHFRR